MLTPSLNCKAKIFTQKVCQPLVQTSRNNLVMKSGSTQNKPKRKQAATNGRFSPKKICFQ